MDFLEGFLLGPLWSDTEYETRKHIGFHLFLGAIIAAGFFWLVLFPGKLTFWLGLPYLLYIILLVLFFLATPFTARMYYQMVLPLKLVVLLVQLGKFACAFLITFKMLLPRFQIDLVELPQTLMEEINLSISRSTEFFERVGRTSGMLLGIVGGGAMIVLRFLLYAALAVLAPIGIVLAVKLAQFVWDYATRKFILREKRS